MSMVSSCVSRFHRVRGVNGSWFYRFLGFMVSFHVFRGFIGLWCQWFHVFRGFIGFVVLMVTWFHRFPGFMVS